MIRAYDEYYLSETQHKLGVMFEIASYIEDMKLDNLFELFLNSKISKAFETADPIYISGRSGSELLATILSKPPVENEFSMFCSPEYWTGYVLAYIQWYLNISFKEIGSIISCEELMMLYFPYHEMDISKVLDVVISKLNTQNKLKMMRIKRNLTQSEFSKLTNVPLRTIKAYEQGDIELEKAQVKTVIIFSKILDCRIEDLLSY